MAYGYIQSFFQFPTAKNGSMHVYIANTTSEALVYDPVNGNTISQPLYIDNDGYVQPFWVETDALYDLDVRSYNGAQLETRNNVSVLGGSAGAVGPQGPQGVQGLQGNPGATGATGTNGTDGTNGTNGTNGTDGVSLVSIRIDPSSTSASVLYTLSNSPTEYNAGDILPQGYGTVQVTSGDTAGYLDSKIYGTDGMVDVISNGSSLVLSLDPSLLTRIEAMEASITDHETRIDVLEAASREKQVVFGGTTGATVVTLPHSLRTSNLAVSCYNTIDNSLIYLSVIVTDTQVSIQGLTPLVSDNQIKVVLLK